MTEQTNLFAYTETYSEGYPGYVSLNVRNERYFLSVRTPSAANASEIELTRSQLEAMAASIFAHKKEPGQA